MGRSRITHAGRALTEKQDRFVRLIAHGVSNREACRLVGINRRTGTRWRLGRTIANTAGEAVHYPPVHIAAPRTRHPRYLSLDERMVIADLRWEQRTVREIARELGRSPATVSRELRRNVDARGRYLPCSADLAATERVARPRARRVTVDAELRAVRAVPVTSGMPFPGHCWVALGEAGLVGHPLARAVGASTPEGDPGVDRSPPLAPGRAQPPDDATRLRCHRRRCQCLVPGRVPGARHLRGGHRKVVARAGALAHAVRAPCSTARTTGDGGLPLVPGRALPPHSPVRPRLEKFWVQRLVAARVPLGQQPRHLTQPLCL